MMKRLFSRRWAARQNSLPASKGGTSKATADEEDYYDSQHGSNNNNNNQQQQIQQQQQYQQQQQHHLRKHKHRRDVDSIGGYTLKTREQFDLEIPAGPVHLTPNHNNNSKNRIHLVPRTVIPSASREAHSSNVSTVTWDSEAKYRHRRRRKRKPSSNGRPTTPLRGGKSAQQQKMPSTPTTSATSAQTTADTRPAATSSSWSNCCCCTLPGGKEAVSRTLLDSITEDERTLMAAATGETPTDFRLEEARDPCSGWTRACTDLCQSDCCDVGGNRRSRRAARELHNVDLYSKSESRNTGYYATAKSMDKSLFDSITAVETTTEDEDDDDNNKPHHQRRAPLKLLRPPGKHLRRALRLQQRIR